MFIISAGLWSEKAYSLTMDDGVKATFVEKSHTVFYDISGNGNHYVLDPTSEKVCQVCTRVSRITCMHWVSLFIVTRRF